MADFGEGVEFGQEFIHGEVRDGEFVEFEGRGFGLSADRDHGIHEVSMFRDIADFQFYALAIEIANSLGAPRAAGFNVEDWFYVFTHSIKLSIERAHDNVKA